MAPEARTARDFGAEISASSTADFRACIVRRLRSIRSPFFLCGRGKSRALLVDRETEVTISCVLDRIKVSRADALVVVFSFSFPGV